MSNLIKIIVAIVILVVSIVLGIAGIAVIGGTDGSEGSGYLIAAFIFFLLFIGLLILTAVDSLRHKNNQPTVSNQNYQTVTGSNYKSKILGIIITIILIIIFGGIIWFLISGTSGTVPR